MSDKPKKASCNAPIAGFAQQQTKTEKIKSVDPRFSDDTNKKELMKNYDFIAEMRQNESKQLEKVLRKDPGNDILKKALMRQK